MRYRSGHLRFSEVALGQEPWALQPHGFSLSSLRIDFFDAKIAKKDDKVLTQKYI